MWYLYAQRAFAVKLQLHLNGFIRWFSMYRKFFIFLLPIVDYLLTIYHQDDERNRLSNFNKTRNIYIFYR